MEPLLEEWGPLLVEQLREQLNNLTAAAQLLTPVVQESGEERHRQYLAILNQSVYRMTRTLNNAEYAQLPEGEPALRRAPLDLAGLCRELERQVTPLAALAGVQFSYEEERACLLTVGDAALLRRMLLSLIATALGAAGSGGQAGLRLADARSAAVLTVWDNGPGLPPCAEGRGAESLLRRPDGLGLGLSIARRVASLHGGALVLEQREGRGLRSVVSLPVCPPERNQMLKTPQMGCDPTGGFSPVLVELSGVLPYQAFLPEDVE